MMLYGRANKILTGLLDNSLADDDHSQYIQSYYIRKFCYLNRKTQENPQQGCFWGHAIEGFLCYHHNKISAST